MKAETADVFSFHGCEQSKVNRILVLVKIYLYDNKYCKTFMIFMINDLNFRDLSSCPVMDITPFVTAFPS